MRCEHFLFVNLILLAILTSAGYWWAYPALWIVPMATWLPLVTRLRNIAEHACVETQDDPFTPRAHDARQSVERLLIAPYWVHFTATTSSCTCPATILRAHKLLMKKATATHALAPAIRGATSRAA